MVFVLATLFSIFNFSPLEECERWHAVRMDNRPAWADTIISRSRAVIDSLTDAASEPVRRGRYTYAKRAVFSRGQVVVMTPAGHVLFGWDNEDRPGFEDSLYFEKLLLVTDQDTTVLDSCHYGYDAIEVSPNSQEIAIFKVQTAGEEHCRGDIVLFNSTNPRGLTLFALAGCGPISFSPNGDYMAFSDYADLYVTEIDFPAAERVLHEGGSYWLGGCTDHHLSVEKLVWSPSSDSLYFEYSAGTAMKQIHRFIIAPR